MPIVAGLVLLILLAVVFGPQVWVHHVLRRHGADRPDLPGTGGELARLLLDEAGQHARGERAFAARVALVGKLVWIDRAATAIMLLAPVVFILVKAPALFALQIFAGILLLAMHVVVHVVTLPVELDASFAKALPLLARGQ